MAGNWWQQIRKQSAFWVVSGILLLFLAGFVLPLFFGSVAGSVTGGGGEVNTDTYMWVAGVIAAIAAAMFFTAFIYILQDRK